jgi:hypothetical protein
MSVKLNSSSGGSVTLQEPTTASNFTLTLPAATGTVLTTAGISAPVEFPAGSASAPSITTTGDTNTGIFFPAADTIAFAEGGVEAMRLDSSGNLQFNSGYGSVAVAYGCRAWVNFNGTGTVAIRASGNVSSITDNGTGDYTVNFTTAMPDANYTVCSGANYLAGVYGRITMRNMGTAPTTSAVRLLCNVIGGGQADMDYVDVLIFR